MENLIEDFARMVNNLTPQERAAIAVEELRKRPLDLLFQGLIANVIHTTQPGQNFALITAAVPIGNTIYQCSAQITFIKP